MLIEPFALVFYKIVGFIKLAHVMIITAYAAEQSVGANSFGGGLGQHANLPTVIEGTRRFHRQPLQEGLGRFTVIEQGQAGGGAKESLDKIQQSLHDKTKKNCAAAGPEAVL